MTSNDIRNVTFERSKKGYRAEDVDDFLLMVAREVETITAEKDAALAAVTSNENKMLILAQKVEEYRGQEDTLKTALINAQRMGETVVHEAKQKAEAMLRDATGKAELLQQKAEREIEREQKTLEMLRNEVSRFRATILNLYKQHIESLSALDDPLERVDEFMEENDIPVAAEVQPEEEITMAQEVEVAMGSANPRLPEEPALAAAGEKDLLQPEPIAASDLFEGIPIDQE